MSRLSKSFVFAWNGIRHCLQHEQNFRIHIIAAIVALISGMFFHCSYIEWIVIILCIAMVISLEMVNTAVERLCNIVQPELDPRIRIIKDVAAGAVLIAAVIAVICAAIIFLPKIILLF